ncbi:RICIN domain-containing protein [Actinosynnema mirum]|uniref:Ricin B lectin domain-containing protein n=1 Tax=Actinosynnema mirum (strain ATCC 29888 / DSM 43827 / JCM 3225 / NBRC 14064 / NCIMB 13271 / NRRL B-12336 / IMRU 3971 / 101) TaxID=446462 RepID=C6WAN4_ACTMD|nr:ricin-type beta-trefoil lectin domain protein [Actinosynnema mirum]ACU37353.1 hypothetical protein Amir_3456 [Actinosynnema mirum DSM 43827]
MPHTRAALRALACALILLSTAAPATAAPHPAQQEVSPQALRYRIFNTEGDCLDGNNPNALYLWDCVNATNQYWYFDVRSDGWTQLRNAKTQRCIRTSSFGAYDVPVVTGPCSSSGEDLWYGIHRESGWYWLAPYGWDSYDDPCINGPRSGNGQGLFMNQCNAQQWPTNYWAWTPIAE